MAPYVYEPFKDKDQEIRLMTLLPGTLSSEIRIELENILLEGNDAKPQYEALSYAWGPAEALTHIKVGDTSANLDITANLSTALAYLRYEDRPRRLWIDAVCVDQHNLSERSEQVLRMGDVYRMATRVVVWLGPKDPSSDAAIEVLEALSSKIRVDWHTTEMTPATAGDADWADSNVVLPYDARTWDAIFALLSRSWFERLWVQQEIRLANASAVVVCGHASMLWGRFASAIFCLRNKTRPVNDGGELTRRIDMAYQMNNNANFRPFGDLIRDTRDCKCADPRDRVYALLSVLGPGESIRVQPDYAKPAGEVYQDVVLQFLSLGQARILASCELREMLSGMPSWVPDWSSPGEATSLRGYMASGNSLGHASYMGEGILKILGVQCAVISEAEEISFQRISDGDIMTALQNLVLQKPNTADILNNNSSYVGGGSLFNAHCRTFCADRFAEDHLPPRSLCPQIEASRKAFRYFVTHNPASPPDPGFETDKYRDHVYYKCRGRYFFRTQEGYIGLAPKHAKAGDLICVILGCATPLVFRPTKNGQYKVIGECFTCGLMSGEALLGPLPKHFQFVWRFDEEFGNHPAYLNRAVGEALVDDPRLGQLPVGWRFKRHRAERAWLWIVGEGADETKVSDPRWTVEALRERNVNLVTFELV